MAVLRRLLVLLALVVGAAVLASPGLSATRYGKRGIDSTAPGPGRCPDPSPATGFELGSAHFLVHYMSDNSASSCDPQRAITETTAGDVLGWAEAAYATEVVADGYQAPLSDGGLGGDNRTDIYVVDDGPLSTVYWDGGPPASSASINLDAKSGLTSEVIAHAVFNVIQIGMWLPASAADYWVLEESAEWMSATVNNYSSWFFTNAGAPDIALDCRDTLGTNKCDLTNGYTNLGFSRWPFWQSVATKYGVGFAKEVLLNGAANPGESGVAALSNVLAAHGTTLADTFTAWSVQQIAGGYGVTVLDQQKPVIWGSKVATGIATATLPKINVPVNHLSTRILEIDRGDGTGANACFAATLTLTVNLPPGIGSRPYFYWNGLNSTPVALTVNGNTATTTQPWDTCTWFGNQAYLTLPNPSTDPIANGQLFTVTAHVDVDNTKPGQSASPPPPAVVSGQVVSVPSSDPAPLISVFGPELLHLSAADTGVRLIVQSSGDGLVQASLGGHPLGVQSVRGGNNDLRWVLPKGVLAGLRRSAGASGNTLVLLPLSPSGSIAGTASTRTVSMPQPAVKRPAKKPKRRLR
ncbi:MAG TPA: hypothetical protein VGN27_05555 [Gaiellaceae bacterium]|nr:hypothetical protein [Gaiellaceae bacterium]